MRWIVRFVFCDGHWWPARNELLRNYSHYLEHNRAIPRVEPIEYEAGVTRQFATRALAKDYAQFSTGRQHPHRFLRWGSTTYRCAFWRHGCPSTRRVALLNGQLTVSGQNDHNHHTAAVGTNRWLSLDEKRRLDSVPRMTPILKQAFCSEMQLTLRQHSNRKYYHSTCRYTSRSLLDWIYDHQGRSFDATIVGFDLGGPIQVIVLAPRDYLHRISAASRCVDGYYAIDGTDDVKGYTILQLGTQDRRHRFHVIAYALVSGGEGKEQVQRFLEILDQKVRQEIPQGSGLAMKSVMMDGGTGIRQGVAASFPDAILGMCFFHMMAAANEHEDLLPKGRVDMAKAKRDIAIMASFPPARFQRAAEATVAEWRSESRKWEAFSDYFEATWLTQLRGWNVAFLGIGSPRTNNALESTWRLLHAFSKGSVCPTTGLDVLFDNVIPHNVRNQCEMSHNLPELSVEDRQTAVELAASDKVCQVTAAGDIWFYCKRRCGGLRPVMTRDDIERYEQLYATPEGWTYSDVQFLASVRKFNAAECTCIDGHIYKTCAHSLAVRIREGQVAAPVSIGQSYGGRPATIQPSKKTRKRQPVTENDDFCAICQRHCSNSYNLCNHIKSSKHLKVAGSFYQELRAARSLTIQGITFTSRCISQLAEGDGVLFCSHCQPKEVLQCTVRKATENGVVVLQTVCGKKFSTKTSDSVYTWQWDNDDLGTDEISSGINAISQPSEHPTDRLTSAATSSESPEQSKQEDVCKAVAGFLSKRNSSPEGVVASLRQLHPPFGTIDDGHDVVEALEKILFSAIEAVERSPCAAESKTRRTCEGYFRSTTKCSESSCSAEVARQESFVVLQPPLDPAKKQDLYDLLRCLQADNCTDYTCETCRRQGLASVRNVVASCPPVLIIQLKRQHLGFISQQAVTYPETLDLQRAFPSCMQQGAMELLFVGLHRPSPSGSGPGHYWSLLRTSNGLVELNDSSVRSDVSTIHRENACLLVYGCPGPLLAPRGIRNLGNTCYISTALQAISSATELRTAVASDVTQAIESLHGGSGLAPALQRHPQIAKSNGLHMRKGIEPTAAREARHQRPNRWSELHRSCSNYLKRNHECLTTMSKEWALQRWHHSPLLASITYRQVLDAVGCHAEYLLHTHPSIPGWEYLVPSAKDMEVLCHLGCRVRWSLVVSDATIWKTGFSNSLWKQLRGLPASAARREALRHFRRACEKIVDGAHGEKTILTTRVRRTFAEEGFVFSLVYAKIIPIGISVQQFTNILSDTNKCSSHSLNMQEVDEASINGCSEAQNNPTADAREARPLFAGCDQGNADGNVDTGHVEADHRPRHSVNSAECPTAVASLVELTGALPTIYWSSIGFLYHFTSGWYDSLGTQLDEDCAAVWNARAVDSIPPSRSRAHARDNPDTVRDSAEINGNGEDIPTTTDALDEQLSIESPSLKNALRQKGIGCLTYNVCLHVYSQKLQPETISRIRSPTQIPFLNINLSPVVDFVGSQLKELRQHTQKVCEYCQCAGCSIPVILPPSGRHPSSAHSDDEDDSAVGLLDNVVDLSDDDCKAAVWWSLLDVFRILEYAYQDGNRKALHEVIVGYESIGGSFKWETNAKQGIHETNHLVGWLVECLYAQRYVVADDLVLYEPAKSPGGIPYHRSRDVLMREAKRPMRTMYDFLVENGVPVEQLPNRQEYMNAIDTLYTKAVISAAISTIQNGTSRVTLVPPSYRYRPFKNCMIDLYTARVYTAQEAQQGNLFGYHYMNENVPSDVIHLLMRLNAYIERGFPNLKAFLAMREDITKLVDGTVFRHYWEYQGYTYQRSHAMEKKCSDLQTMMFNDGLFHVGDLEGAEWLRPQSRIAPDTIVVHLSQQGGTGKSAFSLERQLCDDKKAIWFIPMAAGSDLKEYSGCYGKRVGIGSESVTPTDIRQIRFLDSATLKSTSTREPVGGVRRPKTDPRGQRDLEEPIVLPLMFFYCNYPFWPPGVDSLERRIVVILPSRKIANTHNEILGYSALCAPERVRVMLAGVMMYIATVRVIDKFGTKNDFYPSKRVARDTYRFHRAWKKRFRAVAMIGADKTSSQNHCQNGGGNVHVELQKIVDSIRTKAQTEFQLTGAPDDSVPEWARKKMADDVLEMKRGTVPMRRDSLEQLSAETVFSNKVTFVPQGIAGLELMTREGSDRTLGIRLNGMILASVRNGGQGLCFFRSLSQAVRSTLKDNRQDAEYMRRNIVNYITEQLGLVRATDPFNGDNWPVIEEAQTWDELPVSGAWLDIARDTYGEGITPAEVGRRLQGVLRDEWPTYPLFLKAAAEVAHVNIATIVVSRGITHRTGRVIDGRPSGSEQRHPNRASFEPLWPSF